MQRHAVQRADGIAAGERRIGRRRIAQRLLMTNGDEAVEDRLRPVGPVQRGPHDLGRGNFSIADQAGQVGSGRVGDLGRRHRWFLIRR